MALARYPDAALIGSLPGMGATSTAEFIAEAAGISRFPTADRLAAAAGLAPILKQSGKVRYLRRARDPANSPALPRQLRQSRLTNALGCRLQLERRIHGELELRLSRLRFG